MVVVSTQQPQSRASYFIGSGWQSSLTTLMSNFCSAAQPRQAEFYHIFIMKVISISCGYFVFNSCHFVVVPNYSSYIRHFRDVERVAAWVKTAQRRCRAAAKWLPTICANICKRLPFTTPTFEQTESKSKRLGITLKDTDNRKCGMIKQTLGTILYQHI